MDFLTTRATMPELILFIVGVEALGDHPVMTIILLTPLIEGFASRCEITSYPCLSVVSRHGFIVDTRSHVRLMGEQTR